MNFWSALPPLTLYDAATHVESWLLSKRHSATDTNSKERGRDIVSHENLIKIWNFLKKTLV
jgi:hypothetical protein